jgi:hypothetical protein
MALALPLLLDQGVAGAGVHSGSITFTTRNGERVTCDYSGTSGFNPDNHRGTATTENGIEQTVAPGCRAEIVVRVTYLDTGGDRGQAGASSTEGRTVFLHNYDVADEYVATHELHFLDCTSPDPGDTCAVRFTTK